MYYKKKYLTFIYRSYDIIICNSQLFLSNQAMNDIKLYYYVLQREKRDMINESIFVVVL